MQKVIFQNADNGTVALGEAETPEQIEEFFKRRDLPREIAVVIPLETKLEGHLKRGGGNCCGDIVLRSGNVERIFSRKTELTPDGELFANCCQNGEDVPIGSIGLQFRDTADPATNRGRIWICPDNRPRMWFLLFPQGVESKNRPKAIAQIIADAQNAVQEQVLSKLAA